MRFEINGVSLYYGKVRALDCIDMALEGGQVIGLLGRNGAGKSTLINAMTNKLRPQSGSILLDGRPVWENSDAMKNICCMSEQNLFPDGYRISKLFDEVGLFYPSFDRNRAIELAGRFQLDTSQKVGGLSTGYNSIAKNIIALCSNAPVMIMDEPVLGLDAAHRDMFYKELIRDFSEKQRTVILSTHLIEEVAHIIQQAVIIHRGQVLLQADTEDISRMGYSIAGRKIDVVEYTLGKDIISMDEMGTFATAYMRGDAPRDLPEGLEAGKLSLQKLFVELTGTESIVNNMEGETA